MPSFRRNETHSVVYLVDALYKPEGREFDSSHFPEKKVLMSL
jgi:hypothetical protein